MPHAKQFNRHHRELRFLRTRLGRLMRDIRRKLAGKPELEAAFATPLSRAEQFRVKSRPTATPISLPILTPLGRWGWAYPYIA